MYVCMYACLYAKKHVLHIKYRLLTVVGQQLFTTQPATAKPTLVTDRIKLKTAIAAMRPQSLLPKDESHSPIGK